MSRNRGFTLLELTITLAVGSVIATLSAGLMLKAASSAHSAAERSALAETMLASFDQSSISQQKVVVCASQDGLACAGGLDWSNGWIAFLDMDNDRERGTDDPLLRVHNTLARGLHLRSSVGRTRIVFQPFGGANAGSNVTFTFCDPSGPVEADTIILANTGRMRTAKATPAQAAACMGPA